MNHQTVKRFGPAIGWSAIALLIIVLLVFIVIRSMDTYGGDTPDQLFQTRYREHPLVTAVHMLAGFLFVLLAPLQFLPKLRARRLSLHRGLGRVLVSSAIIAGLYGLIASVTLPAFGGLPTETAAWFFGPLFLFSLIRALWCARRRKIAQHREWMIRAFAMGLAVGVQRILIPLLMIFGGYSFEAVFGPALWLGFGFNLLVAEFWINVTRIKESPGNDK